MLCNWPLLLSWAQQGKAEEHFGEAGLTNLLHLLRDALRKATGGQLGGGADAHRAKQQSRERQQAQVRGHARCADRLGFFFSFEAALPPHLRLQFSSRQL